jgi:peptide deformylase
MIITDEKLLRVKCEDVLPNEVGELVDLLERELKLAPSGIGLAAPQIGVAKNIAIVRINDKYSINLINCHIKQGFDEAIFEDEGCLSFPGKFVKTMRYNEIYVVENLVEPRSFIAHGLPAVVIQHELNHLNGILLPDLEIKEKIKTKVRPNDPCDCKSGKKAKKCCHQ